MARRPLGACRGQGAFYKFRHPLTLRGQAAAALAGSSSASERFVAPVCELAGPDALDRCTLLHSDGDGAHFRGVRLHGGLGAGLAAAAVGGSRMPAPPGSPLAQLLWLQQLLIGSLLWPGTAGHPAHILNSFGRGLGLATQLPPLLPALHPPPGEGLQLVTELASRAAGCAAEKYTAAAAVSAAAAAAAPGAVGRDGAALQLSERLASWFTAPSAQPALAAHSCAMQGGGPPNGRHRRGGQPRHQPAWKDWIPALATCALIVFVSGAAVLHLNLQASRIGPDRLPATRQPTGAPSSGGTAQLTGEASQAGTNQASDASAPASLNAPLVLPPEPPRLSDQAEHLTDAELHGGWKLTWEV